MIAKLNRDEEWSSVYHIDQGEESMRALKGLFRDHPEFASDETVAAFLGFESSGNVHSNEETQKEAYVKCEKWVEECRLLLVEKYSGGLSAASAGELWELIAPFAGIDLCESQEAAQELEFDQSSLVERIEIFGKFRSQYFIGDCPGPCDINKARSTSRLYDCNLN